MSVSRPLPLIEIRRPSADRGAEDVREHLDGQRCIFCNVPVAEDEQMIKMDKFGLRVFRPLCKGHSEHPENWRVAKQEGDQPEKWGFCPTCGEPTMQYYGRDQECSACDPVDLDTWRDRCV